MKRPMVCAAQAHEIVRIVFTALGARLDVVDVDEHRVTATRYDAAAAIAAHDQTSRCGWNGLACARAGPHVGRTDHLRITARHVDDFWRDLDEFPSAMLLPSFAPIAYGERNLIACSSWFGGASKYMTSHQQNGRVVVE